MKPARTTPLKLLGPLVALLATGLLACALPASADELPPLPAVRLADHKDYDDETAFQHFVAQEVAALTERAAQVPDAPKRAELQLTAANLILAVQLEPACTRALLELPIEQTPAELRHVFEQARSLLAEAQESLSQPQAEKVAPAAEDAQARKRAELVQVSGVLQAFATGLEAYLLPADDSEQTTTARKAASGLAVLLEQDNQAVAAAASLWHAALRARSGEPERVLAFVPLTLKEPGREELPYAFFSRLLRCRLIAARPQGAAAALALLYQLEERCNEWFTEPAPRAQAFHAASLVELEILGTWHARLSKPEQEPARQWCRNQMQAVTKERFAEPSRPVYRLGNAVPLLLMPPAKDLPPEGQAETDTDD